MKKVETQILKCLLEESKKSFWEMLDENQHTVKDFAAALNDLFRNGLIDVEKDGIHLTERGLKYVNKDITGFKSKVCDKCEGKKILFNGRFKELMKEFAQIVKDRPLPRVGFF